MSMDRSLKSASTLVRHRNVLTRDERLLKLKEVEKWNEEKSPMGLPKVGHRKAAVAKAVKKVDEEGAAAPGGKAAGGKAAAGKAAPAAKAAAGKAAPAAKAAAGKAAPAAKKK